MRDTSSVGRPGWRLFPPEWETHHYGIADQQMTALVNLWAGPAQRTYDPVTEEETGWDLGLRLTPEPVAARLQQISQPEDAETAGQEVTTHDYRVSLPVHTVPATTLAVVAVVECSDPTLVGVRLQVVDILRGSLRWQRDLIASDFLG